jgi:hypothetical protein
MRKPTIYEALKEKLGREPSNDELKAEVQRIKDEGYVMAATQGKLRHQKSRRRSRKNANKISTPPFYRDVDHPVMHMDDDGPTAEEWNLPLGQRRGQPTNPRLVPGSIWRAKNGKWSGERFEFIRVRDRYWVGRSLDDGTEIEIELSLADEYLAPER